VSDGSTVADSLKRRVRAFHEDGQRSWLLSDEGNLMSELELLEGEAVPLALELRTVRGRPTPEVPFRLDERIAVGLPQIRRLSPADAGPDAELAHFIESESAKWDYFLAALSCTFISDSNQLLVSAWLRLSLTCPSGSGSEGPIACSMDPLVLDEIRALPYTIKLTVPCVISSEISLQGDRAKHETAVQALYEGTDKPAWTFAETSAKRLHGVQRLRLVVRAPAGRPVKGSIEVGATVRHRRLGSDVFSYTAPATGLPESLQFDFGR
jgi:hypothetical protein